MLMDYEQVFDTKSLNSKISSAEKFDSTTSFGDDIDAANVKMLDPALSHDEKCSAFLSWSSRFQPCLFGRLGSRGLHGIGIDMCWIDEAEIAEGDELVRRKIQRARRRWKERAATGVTHGFLVMFSGPRLARLKPGPDLLDMCEAIANLYLVEHAPVRRDVIYTEAVPLQTPAGLGLFKAGMNLFYPAAHRTRNHDRRVPGGIMLSVNSVGHWANSLVLRGLAPDLSVATDEVLETALRSIGNGGIGHETTPSASWHNIARDPAEVEKRRKTPKLPRYIPQDYAQHSYSALYHTDVLVPTDVTLDRTIDPDVATCEHWKHLSLEYISEKVLPEHDVDYGLFHGHPIKPEAMFHNPWPPERAYNLDMTG